MSKPNQTHIFFLLYTLIILFAQNTIGQEVKDSIIAKTANDFFMSRTGKSEFYRIDIDSVSENITLFNYLVRPSTYEIKGTGYVLMGELNGTTQVLAYSDAGELNLQASTIKKLLRSYQNQIDSLKVKGGSFTQNTTHRMYCEPLLKDITWGQGTPYNNYLPIDKDGNRYLLGCMAVAMGQIMHYYQYPEKGENSSLYINHSQKYTPPTMVNYSDYSVDWDQVEPYYTPADSLKARVDICELLYYSALSVGAEFSSVGTSATINNAYLSLLQHFRFHPKASLLDGINTPTSIILDCLYHELAQKRPIMISSFGHAFLCDGCIDDYFHLNWGWYGQCNGYFKFTLLPEDQPLCLPEHAIINLFPRIKQAELELSVTTDTIETLKDKLPQDDTLWNISKLKISGPLTGDDLVLIRQMAGAKKAWEPGGSLQELNLEDAIFLYDSISPYFNRDLKQEHAIYTYTHTVNGVSTRNKIDFSNATLEDWENFRLLQERLTTEKGSIFFAKDDIFFEGLLLQKNIIGEVLFKDCTSLRKIILPKSTKKIGNEAFRGCFLLKEVALPATLEEIEVSAFSRCTLLDCLKLDPLNQSFCVKDGVVYTKDMKQLICNMPHYKKTHLKIPETVEIIHDYAFSDNIFLCDIELPPHIEFISNGMFHKCISLKHIKIPVGVKQIKNWAFSYCNSLTDIFIPSTVTKIGEEVFTNCYSLEQLYCSPAQLNLHISSKNELESLSVKIKDIETETSEKIIETTEANSEEELIIEEVEEEREGEEETSDESIKTKQVE